MLVHYTHFVSVRLCNIMHFKAYQIFNVKKNLTVFAHIINSSEKLIWKQYCWKLLDRRHRSLRRWNLALVLKQASADDYLIIKHGTRKRKKVLAWMKIVDPYDQSVFWEMISVMYSKSISTNSHRIKYLWGFVIPVFLSQYVLIIIRILTDF
jgi:hypothetical protein